MAEADVTIRLSSDEALVLFELLQRWERDEHVTVPKHQAEQIALWNLSALLEAQLPEPLDARYADLVSEAGASLTPSD